MTDIPFRPSGGPKPVGEHMTAAGAERMAASIRAYWGATGDRKPPRVWVEKYCGTRGRVGGEFFFVRSDMVNGQPL